MKKFFTNNKGICLGAAYAEKLENGLDKLKEPVKDLVEKLLEALSNRSYYGTKVQDLFWGWIDTNQIQTVENFFTGHMAEAIEYILGEEQMGNFMQWVQIKHLMIYSVGSSRRTLRSKNIKLHLKQLINSDLYQFFALAATPLTIKNLLEESEDETVNRLYSLVQGSSILTVEIEKGNQEVIGIIRDLLTGETTSGSKLKYPILKAIFMSSNEELYELAGKLLLAARLQEGLRQSIVETMDCGRPEAFRYMFNVIRENDLQRFSSVKRAVGTWTGLFQEGAEDRVNQKVLDLIYLCLQDKNYALDCLNGKDTMEIFIALWSIGFYSIEEAEQYIIHILEEGVKHKVLTASFFATITLHDELRNKIGPLVLARYVEDDSIIAGALQHIICGFHVNNLAYGQSPKNQLLEFFFATPEKAKETYYLLKKVASRAKKEETFSPYIFPWYAIKMEKSEILFKMIGIAWLLKDNDIIDDLCKDVLFMDTYGRTAFIKGILSKPATEIQLNTLVQALGDRGEMPRQRAFEALKDYPLETSHFRQLEDLLRFKSGDLRQNVIKLLMKLSPDELAGTVERLLADKLADKRLGGLELLILAKDKPDYTTIVQEIALSLETISKPTSKEQIMIAQLSTSLSQKANGDEVVYSRENGFGLIKEKNEVVIPSFDLDPDFQIRDYFPLAEKELLLLFQKLSALIGQYAEHEYLNKWGTTHLVGKYLQEEKEKGKEKKEIDRYPLAEVWKAFYEEEIKDFSRLQQMHFVYQQKKETQLRIDSFGKWINRFYGMDLYGIGEKLKKLNYPAQMEKVLELLRDEYVDYAKAFAIHRQVLPQLLMFLTDEESKPGGQNENAPVPVYSRFIPEFNIIGNEHICFPHTVTRYNREETKVECILFSNAITYWFRGRDWDKDEMFPTVFFNEYACYKALNYNKTITYNETAVPLTTNIVDPGMNYFAVAYELGIIPEEELIRKLFVYPGAMDAFKSMILFINGFKNLNCKDNPCKVHRHGCKKNTEVFNKVTRRILDIELKRGDTPTPVSAHALKMMQVYGADVMVDVLKAMGKDTFDRSDYHYKSSYTKKEVLSHLLRICHPAEGDDIKRLKELLKGTDITEIRLIEAAIYATQWLELVQEYTGWKGLSSAVYYFHAHMNDYFDAQKKALIARYTPIEPEDLKLGAFDIEWFKEAYKEIGEKRFEVVYDAAKYISSGGAHTRARKFADAVTGKLDIKATRKEIEAKRNKDLLMAYTLIPLNKRSKKDLPERYQYLQQFLKESKQFGAQRQDSEKKAVEIAMQNLARNAGYDDVTRLVWSMETRLIKDMAAYFTPKTLEGVDVFVQIDEGGKSSVCYLKDGKFLNSTPAKLKKNKYIDELKAVHKKLKDQYSRSRIMLEQAMEDQTWFLKSELDLLTENPVIWPLLRHLVFVDEEGKTGFFRNGGLTDFNDTETLLEETAKIRIAHVVDLYQHEVWYNFQKYLFDQQLRQPFKQVFRELYVKTEEEKPMVHSLRYAGNQIQPQKTVAVLKNRRWIANYEAGLQKVYYKENVIASIYAQADWFSPSDIEAPTLEWVAFYDRKTGKAMTVDAIPDILFSEIMRDVDLAVSVAHAGGVDPETSHSTVEMRSAIIGFTLPLFKLENVRLKGSHAFVEGKLGNYNIHLGSGIIHQEAGAAINVLPVHSQHRGKLFLPFIDEDPKTAEIISKIILFAEDNKIKDPFILEQIKRK